MNNPFYFFSNGDILNLNNVSCIFRNPKTEKKTSHTVYIDSARSWDISEQSYKDIVARIKSLKDIHIND